MFHSARALFQEQETVYQAPNRFWFLLGTIAMFGYAFFALQSTVLEMWCHDLTVLALLVSLFKAPKPARTEPVLWMLGAMLLLALFSYAKTHLLLPEYAESDVYLHKLLAVFGFFVIAWWLGGDVRRVFWLLGLALVGFFVALVVHAHWKHILLGLRGRRVDFGFHNAQHTAMFFSVALMGWSIFSLRFLRFLRSKGAKVLRFVLWGTVYGALLAGVIVTQTRAAWLGLGAAVVVAAVLYVVRAGSSETSRRTVVMVLISMIAVAALALTFARPSLEKRFAAEQVILEQVERGEIDYVPDTSLGIRIKLWQEGLKWIAERPLTGWGYTIRDRFIADSPNLSPLLKTFGHIHNSYLEILLIYGAVGVVVFGALIMFVSTRVWSAWRKGDIPFDVALLGFCFFAFWLVVNLFESYVFGKTGTYLMALVVGSVYTFPLATSLRRPTAVAGSDVEGALSDGGSTSR